VGRVEVTVVMDNAIDILAATSEGVGQPPWRWDWSEGDQLRAEHRYSLLVTVSRDTIRGPGFNVTQPTGRRDPERRGGSALPLSVKSATQSREAAHNDGLLPLLAPYKAH
jgi:hypothetical protein